MSEPNANQFEGEPPLDDVALKIDIPTEFEPWSLPAETDLDKVQMGGLNFDDDLPAFVVFIPSHGKYEH